MRNTKKRKVKIMKKANQYEYVISKKRDAMARTLLYIFLIIIVTSVFLPIISVSSTKYIYDAEVTSVASISPFQFLIGNTEVDIKVKVSDNDLASGFFSEIAGTIDVAKEIFGADESSGRIALITLMAFISIFSLLSSILLPEIKKSPRYIERRMAMNLSNKSVMFENIENLYFYLPKLLLLIQLSSLAILVYPFVMMVLNKTSDVKFIPYIIVLTVILACFVAMLVLSLKDKKNCTENKDCIELYINPSIISDLRLISSLFLPTKANTSTSEYQTIDALKKYKELLDSGIITEEEFNAKKQELLKE